MSAFGLTVHILDASGAAFCIMYMKTCWQFVPNALSTISGDIFFYAMYQGNNLIGAMICQSTPNGWFVSSMCFHSNALNIAQLSDMERLFLASIKPQRQIQTPLPATVVVG